MPESDQPLTEKQTILVQYLASGKTIADSARLTGIGDKTARRWLKLPHMQAALAQVQAVVIEDVKARIAQRFEELADKAVATIERHLDFDTPTAMKAAQLVLDRVAPVEPMQSGDAHSGGPQLDLSSLSSQQLDQLHGWLRQAEQERAGQEEKIVQMPLRKRG